jgi:hypothetical protein
MSVESDKPNKRTLERDDSESDIEDDLDREGKREQAPIDQDSSMEQSSQED